jgi:hypothetical protein
MARRQPIPTRRNVSVTQPLAQHENQQTNSVATVNINHASKTSPETEWRFT